MTVPKRLALSVAFLLCLGTAWAGRSFLGEVALRHLLLPLIQTQLPGVQMQFQDINTNLLSRLQFTQLSMDYCPNANCLRLQIPSLTLSYSLAEIFPWRGTDSLLQQLTVELQGASLIADFASDGSSLSPATFMLPALPTLPAISIKDSSLAIKVDGVTINTHGLTAVAPFFDGTKAEAYEVKLTAEGLAIGGGALPPQQGSIATTLSFQPGRLQVPSLFFQETLLLDDGLLESDTQGLRFSMRLHLLQSQGLVQGSMGQDALRLAFHLAEGDLQELAKAAGDKAQVSGRLQADGEMTMEIAHPENLAATVRAQIVEGSWNGSPINLLELSARAADQILSIDTLKCTIDQNQLTVKDAVLPITALKKQAWSPLLAASRATAHIHLATPQALPPVWSAPFLGDWQDLGLALATADVILRDGRLLVPQAEVSGQAGRLRIQGAEVDLSADLSAWQEVPWSLSWQAEISDAAVVHHFYEDWPATGGKAQGHGTFSGTLAEPHLPFEASFIGASLYGIPLATVAGQVEWSKDRLALDLTANNHDRDQLTFRGTIDLDKGELLTTKVAADLADLHPYLPKAIFANSMISGSLTGAANLSGPFSGLIGTLTASGDWSVQGTKLSAAALDASLSGRQLSVKGLSMVLDDAVTINTAGRVELSQDWGHTAVDLDRLALSYHDQQLNLVAPGGLTFSASTVSVRAPLSLVGPLGRFRLEEQKGKAAALALVGEDLRDTGLLKQLSGRDIAFSSMGFTLGMSGPLSHPDWRWQGDMQGLAVAGADLTMNGIFDLAYGDQGLNLTQCTLANSDNSITLSGHLPLTVNKGHWIFLPTPLEFKAKVNLPEGGVLPRLFPEWLLASGDVRADLNFSGTLEQPLGQIQFSGRGLNPGPRMALLPPGRFDTQGLLTVEKDQVAISNFEVSSPGLTLHMAGAIQQLPLAALVDAKRDSLPGQVEIRGHYAMPALDWVATKVSAFRRTAGTASGSFVLSGPLSQPEVQAELDVKNGTLRGSDSLLVFRDITLQAALDHEQVTIKSLSGTLGGSPLQAAGQVKAVFSDAPELDLQLIGKDLLLYRADGFKIRADTSLTLAGTAKLPVLSGDIMLTDSRINKRVDWLSFLKPGKNHNDNAGLSLFSFEDAPLKDTTLDIRIKAAQPMLIANNVFKGEVRPDLLLAGTGEVPYLKGVVYADNGRVTLPSGRLNLERGLIRFVENAPDRPQLEFQASGQMMAYDITAQVRGTYDEPEVTLSSVPPLASEDLLLLLLTGRQPVNAGQANNGVSTVAVYFGRGLLTRLFGEKADQLLLLDRLEVDMGRAATKQGEPTVDAKIKLADDLWMANTSYYLTGEKDIWDDYNGGVRAVFHFR